VNLQSAISQFSRIIMLETVAGVPGMIAAMARHFHSLRKLTRDHGWIHTLLGIVSFFESCEALQRKKYFQCQMYLFKCK